jgi:hypothetical protein
MKRPLIEINLKHSHVITEGGGEGWEKGWN